MKRLFALLPILLMALCLSAESRIDRSWNRHEVRLGWGDQLFEMLAWREEAAKAVGHLPEEKTFRYDENFRYTQHIFAEYQYRFNSWFGFGGMIDGSSVYWDRVTRNGLGGALETEKNRNFFNLVIMPTVRFTYFWHEYVNIYSGLGFGMNINGGTEKDMYGHRVVCAPVLDLRLLGIGVNYQRYFINIDFGGTYSLLDTNTIFMANSRIITASIGARF